MQMKPSTLLLLVILVNCLFVTVSAWQQPQQQQYTRTHSLRLQSYTCGEECVKETARNPYNFLRSSLEGNNNNVEVFDSYKSYYFTELLIGTPAQSFLVSLDTGSSDLWVSGTACKTAGCKKHHLFNSSASSTFVNTKSSFSIHYLGGDTTGIIGKDSVQLGDLNITNFGFGVSTNSSSLFDKVKFDGIMGLAFPGISSIHQPTIIDVLYQQGQIDCNCFAIYLSPSQNSNDSILTLGGIDQTISKIEEFKFYPIIKQLQFVLEGRYIQFNGTQINITQVVIDSGTSTISGPESILGPIFNSFPAQIDCLNLGQYPTLTFNIAGDDYVLDPEDYVYSYIYQGVVSCRVGLKYFALHTPGQIILGDTFMRRYYTLFDKTNNRIGFANLRKDANSQ